MSNAYVDALKGLGNASHIKMAGSEKKDSWDNQQGMCYFCRKMLNKFYFKYVKLDGNLRAVCMDCYFQRKLS